MSRRRPPHPDPRRRDHDDPEGGPFPAVFLGRDGVLVDPQRDPALRWEDLEWTPDMFPALRRLYDVGFKLVVVVNQPEVGEGLAETAEVQGVHQRIRREFAARRLHLDAVYHCPHRAGRGCRCRTPEPGMILQAAQDLDLDLARSYLLSALREDVEAGREAGVRKAILVERGRDVRAGVEEILEDRAPHKDR